MSIPTKATNILRQGRIVGAELAAPRPEFRAFVLIIPQIPDQTENPLLRNEGGVIGLKDPSLINGYEVRHLEHHAKYTDEEWGMDYDYVLNDTTTRIKRIYVKREDEIEIALTQWLKDLSELKEPDDFDSSLVNSPIDYYLNRPEERPHLWI